MKKNRLKKSNREVAISKIAEAALNHLNRQISPLAHKVIFFDASRAAYTKEKTDLDIFSIVNLRKVTAGPSAKAIKSNQERLF